MKRKHKFTILLAVVIILLSYLTFKYYKQLYIYYSYNNLINNSQVELLNKMPVIHPLKFKSFESYDKFCNLLIPYEQLNLNNVLTAKNYNSIILSSKDYFIVVSKPKFELTINDDKRTSLMENKYLDMKKVLLTKPVSIADYNDLKFTDYRCYINKLQSKRILVAKENYQLFESEQLNAILLKNSKTSFYYIPASDQMVSSNSKLYTGFLIKSDNFYLHNITFVFDEKYSDQQALDIIAHFLSSIKFDPQFTNFYDWEKSLQQDIERLSKKYEKDSPKRPQ